ncbi:TIM barrel protein [Candidatus Woesearchaeota archaeon]|nr:TIM barrel protein [Candidatus Woesearchaeota archaeon]
MIKMDKLRFGTAGIPIYASKLGTVNGVKAVRELGLECMELEFVHSVNISKEKAPLVKEMAKKHDVEMTCHAPFYVNLSSLEKEKIGASRSRILKSAEIANMCGAKSVTFHAGFYMKQDPEKVYQMIKEQTKKIVAELKERGNPILVRPETTGKGTQWGTVKEIVRLSEEVEQVLPCVDFAHLYARSIGKVNDYNQFTEVLSHIEERLGKEALRNMHIHMSGIHHGPKGERHHLFLSDSGFNYLDVLKALKTFKCKGVVISESPNIEDDALLMQKVYQEF